MGPPGHTLGRGGVGEGAVGVARPEVQARGQAHRDRVVGRVADQTLGVFERDVVRPLALGFPDHDGAILPEVGTFAEGGRNVVCHRGRTATACDLCQGGQRWSRDFGSEGRQIGKGYVSVRRSREIEAERVVVVARRMHDCARGRGVTAEHAAPVDSTRGEPVVEQLEAPSAG